MLSCDVIVFRGSSQLVYLPILPLSLFIDHQIGCTRDETALLIYWLAEFYFILFFIVISTIFASRWYYCRKTQPGMTYVVPHNLEPPNTENNSNRQSVKMLNRLLINSKILNVKNNIEHLVVFMIFGGSGLYGTTY